MTLKAIAFDHASAVAPSEVVDFLRAVEHLVERHRTDSQLTLGGFIPSDYSLVYSGLKWLSDSHLLCGDRFCEWGSGVGVVASLAAMIGYESYGIERDRALCAAAEQLRRDFSVPVQFFQGSYIPDGVDDLIDRAFTAFDGELSLDIESVQAYDELGYTIDDFDLIFTYPWPNDVELTLDIFDRCAAHGALHLAYHSDSSLMLHRKI